MKKQWRAELRRLKNEIKDSRTAFWKYEAAETKMARALEKRVREIRTNIAREARLAQKHNRRRNERIAVLEGRLAA